MYVQVPHVVAIAFLMVLVEPDQQPVLHLPKQKPLIAQITALHCQCLLKQPGFFKCEVWFFYHCRCPCSSWVLHKLNSLPTFSKNLINKPPNFFQQGRISILILIADILFCIIWKIGVRIKIHFEQFWQKSFFKNPHFLKIPLIWVYLVILWKY